MEKFVSYGSPPFLFILFQCTSQELALLLTCLKNCGDAFGPFQTPSDVGFKSYILNDIIFSLSSLKEPMIALYKDINIVQAGKGVKEKLWYDPTKYPKLSEYEDV